MLGMNLVKAHCGIIGSKSHSKRKN